MYAVDGALGSAAATARCVAAVAVDAAGLVLRARLVLLAADGAGTADIVGPVWLSKLAAVGLRRRSAAEVIAGL